MAHGMHESRLQVTKTARRMHESRLQVTKMGANDSKNWVVHMFHLQVWHEGGAVGHGRVSLSKLLSLILPFWNFQLRGVMIRWKSARIYHFLPFLIISYDSLRFLTIPSHNLTKTSPDFTNSESQIWTRVVTKRFWTKQCLGDPWVNSHQTIYFLW